MSFKKYRWSKDYEAAEEELELLLDRIAGTSERVELEAYEVATPKLNDDPRRLWCAEGSIRFDINGQAISLQPGDALDIAANTPHSATAGVAGCVYYEARS